MQSNILEWNNATRIKLQTVTHLIMFFTMLLITISYQILYNNYEKEEEEAKGFFSSS